jgi:hypothetical protein
MKAMMKSRTMSVRTVTIKMKPIRMRPKMVAAVTDDSVSDDDDVDAAQARMRAEMEKMKSSDPEFHLKEMKNHFGIRRRRR